LRCTVMADLFGLCKSLGGNLVTETRPPRERLK
jgi:hypothetical protein